MTVGVSESKGMYLRRVHIQNIRILREVNWELPNVGGSWNVVLGDNGAGKSTLLRAIALGLIGPAEAASARQDWPSWIGKEADTASVELYLVKGDADDHWGKGNTGVWESANLTLQKVGDQPVSPVPAKDGNEQRHVWGPLGRGWFSTGLGPFRRFQGGDPNTNRLFHSNPKLAAHITLFGEDHALTECEPWLKDQLLRKLQGKGGKSGLLDHLKSFINQEGFLPTGFRMDEISADGLFFEDSSGFRVPFRDMSDGFRSLLSLTVELIRQLTLSYGADQVFEQGQILRDGVVLVDEIDAHLHPNWQKEIGFSLRRMFPNLQFIVTTHSPLVCHAAAENGAILRLRLTEGQVEALDLAGEDRKRLVNGDIVQGLESAGFDAGVTRSEKANEMLEELAALNLAQLRGSLSEEQKAQFAELKEKLPSQ